MTAREQEILQIIKRNPMISQNEIADLLNLTRSSVSVYITNLTKAGLIRGRGYILEDEGYPVVIGTSALDILSVFDTYNIDNDPRLPQKNCNISFVYSGGAKNVSEYLARLDRHPRLISALARDQFGEKIALECNQHGISTDHSLFLENASTTMFLEVDGPDLHISGLASSPIEQKISPAFLETKYVCLKEAGLIAVEDRLSRDTIEYLTSAFRTTPVYLLTSRRFSNVENYRACLSRFTGMQFSFLVASYLAEMDNVALLGTSVDDDVMITVAQGLAALTAPNSHILFPAPGGNICYLRERQLFVITLPWSAEELDTFKSTRDAMIAGLIDCVCVGRNAEETLLFVASCHEIARKSTGAFNPEICLALVNTVRQELEKRCIIRRLF